MPTNAEFGVSVFSAVAATVLAAAVAYVVVAIVASAVSYVVVAVVPTNAELGGSVVSAVAAMCLLRLRQRWQLLWLQ